MASVELGISVAVIEIALGVFAGNVLGITSTPWIDFLAAFAGILLTFLAGAEVDPGLFRQRFRESVVIGGLSFVIPFVAAGLLAYFVAGWDLRQSEIAGIALSTTSLAVVYAVLVETGLTNTEIGKVIMAATFVTDLGTATALSVLFIQPTPFLALFFVVSVVVIVAMLVLQPWFFRRYGDRVIEPEIKGAFVVLFLLMWTADLAKSQAVLPAFLLGLAVARVFQSHREQQKRFRVVAFSLLTPFFFPKRRHERDPRRARRRASASWSVLRCKDRREVRRRVPAVAALATRARDLHDAPHEHGPDVRNDLVALRSERGDHRSHAVLGPDHDRDPLSDRADLPRAALLLSANPRAEPERRRGDRRRGVRTKVIEAGRRGVGPTAAVRAASGSSERAAPSRRSIAIPRGAERRRPPRCSGPSRTESHDCRERAARSERNRSRRRARRARA
jgi:hypothetical protein